MTLREFVERGPIGTRAEREAFETVLLEAWAHASDAQLPAPLADDLDAAMLDVTFLATRDIHARAGTPLGAPANDTGE